MRAAVFVAPRTLEVQDVPDLVIGPGEVLVKNQVSGICGSDIHLYSDTIPEFTPRILGKVLGHELCGEVVAVAPDVANVAVGERVAIEVRDRPTRRQLRDAGLKPDELLLGLYVGRPETERSVLDAPRLPDVIFLFREDLEDACDDEAQLEEEIRVTLLHELGHYFGFDEDDLSDLGYA